MMMMMIMMVEVAVAWTLILQVKLYDLYSNSTGNNYIRSDTNNDFQTIIPVLSPSNIEFADVAIGLGFP